MFIKIGNHVINLNAIAKINLNAVNSYRRTGIEITLLSIEATSIGESSCSESQSIFFADETPEAKAICKYFSCLERVQSLLPDTEEEALYLEFRDRGGRLNFPD